LIFHFWGYTELEDFLRSYEGPKAIHYHNITPPHYFSPQSRQFQMTTRGYELLQRIADWFDLITGDSNYNLAEYARFLTRPKPTLWIPPVVEAEAVQTALFDEPLYQQLRAAAQVNFLFIGRIAQNKRQDQVMRVFDYYYREVNRYSRLYLVGAFDPNSPYYQELQKLRQDLASREQIIFTGKVSDEVVQAYYRAAHIFLSASEHEGFGVPLLEAMAHNIPVVALAITAVPETMGEAGILIHKWDIPRVAELINLLLKDKQWHTKLLAGQQQNLQRFSTAEVCYRLAAAVDFLRQGEESSFIIWRGPDL
jgi:glycosyltransferase involved in cell wall biosynthesis